MDKVGTIGIGGDGNTNNPPVVKNTVKRVKHWCFTHNNYDQKDIKQIINWMGTIGTTIYVFQEETGESGTPHLQGYIGFNKPMRFQTLKNFNKKINWSPCRNIKASIEYCHKEDTRTGEVYTKGIKVRAKLINPMDGLKKYDWQLEIDELLKTKPDGRTVNWYWEPTGKAGKSVYTKNLVMTQQGTIASGKAENVFYAVKNWVKEKDLDFLVLDIPRCTADYVSYQAMEKVLDGLFFSGKYESEAVLFNPPHLIVFGNQKPDIFKMSKDRWNIKRIKGGI